MNIQPLPTTCSKADELEALKKITKKIFPEGTYIYDLFSDRFLSWIEQAMRDDTPPDIFQVVDFFKDQANQAIAEANERETTARMVERNLKNAIAMIEEQVKRSDEETERQLNRAIRAEKDRDRQEERASFAEMKLAAASRVIDARELEIIQLKARLFDLMNQPEPEPESGPAAECHGYYNHTD